MAKPTGKTVILLVIVDMLYCRRCSFAQLLSNIEPTFKDDSVTVAWGEMTGRVGNGEIDRARRGCSILYEERVSNEYEPHRRTS